MFQIGTELRTTEENTKQHTKAKSLKGGASDGAAFHCYGAFPRCDLMKAVGSTNPVLSLA